MYYDLRSQIHPHEEMRQLSCPCWAFFRTILLERSNVGTSDELGWVKNEVRWAFSEKQNCCTSTEKQIVENERAKGVIRVTFLVNI